MSEWQFCAIAPRRPVTKHSPEVPYEKSTDFQISERFADSRCDVDELIAPLIGLTRRSSSLVIGYGMPQAGVRGR